MKKISILLALIVLTFSFQITYSQEKNNIIENNGVFSNEVIKPEAFNDGLFQEVLLSKINFVLDSMGYEGFEIDPFFTGAAQKHAEYMASVQEATIDDKTGGIFDRLVAAGGSGIGNELINKLSIRVSNEYLTYDVAAEQILSRWTSGKLLRELTAQKYFFAGISGKIDETGKKIYVSMFLGNYNSMKSPSLVKSKAKVKPYDITVCKKATSKMPNVVDLQSGITIDAENNIIFEYNNLKKFKKLIRDSKDGLAVDFVKKSKYENCTDEVIPSNNTKSTVGDATKPLYFKKIYKNNLAEGEGKRNKVTKLKINLGKVPETISDINDYETNLLIIKNKFVCEEITQSFVDKKVYNFVPKITLLPDTIELEGAGRYFPKSTSSELKFRINFEKGKYDYKPEDMIPVIQALNEPDFIINKILIEAHSSLEGSKQQNEVLQKKRAASIVKAFEENQNASIIDSIILSDSYEQLKKDVENTVFDELISMNYNDAVKYVNANAEKMEIILGFHRYADITVWITYDAEGDKEQNFVINQFNKAIEADSLDRALNIQKYVLKRVIENRYTENAINNMTIPQGKKYVGLNMNKIWLTQYYFLEPLDEEYLDKIDVLNQLDNSNIYVEYNDIICETELLDLRDEKLQENLQKRIDKLYNTSLAVNLVDLINIELQCQIINTFKDSLEYSHPTMQKCLTKLKEIIHFDELKWDNALKMAGIFIVHNDYVYATRLLEPWVTKKDIPFELISTYVTVCSKIPEKYQSNRFAEAMMIVKERDANYFCNLFKGDKLSKQIFTNKKVKDIYCTSCIGK